MPQVKPCIRLYSLILNSIFSLHLYPEVHDKGRVLQ